MGFVWIVDYSAFGDVEEFVEGSCDDTAVVVELDASAFKSPRIVEEFVGGVVVVEDREMVTLIFLDVWGMGDVSSEIREMFNVREHFGLRRLNGKFPIPAPIG